MTAICSDPIKAEEGQQSHLPKFLFTNLIHYFIEIKKKKTVTVLQPLNIKAESDELQKHVFRQHQEHL